MRRSLSLLVVMMMLTLIPSMDSPVVSGLDMDWELSDSWGSFIGEEALDRSGYSYSNAAIANAGDVNGDGYDDILIGACQNDENGKNAGQTYLIFGSDTGWSMDTDLSSVNASFWGEKSSVPLVTQSSYHATDRPVAQFGGIQGSLVHKVAMDQAPGLPEYLELGGLPGRLSNVRFKQQPSSAKSDPGPEGRGGQYKEC